MIEQGRSAFLIHLPSRKLASFHQSLRRVSSLYEQGWALSILSLAKNWRIVDLQRYAISCLATRLQLRAVEPTVTSGSSWHELPTRLHTKLPTATEWRSAMVVSTDTRSTNSSQCAARSLNYKCSSKTLVRLFSYYCHLPCKQQAMKEKGLQTQFYHSTPSRHSDTLGQIPWVIHIVAPSNGEVVAKQLHR